MMGNFAHGRKVSNVLRKNGVDTVGFLSLESNG